MAKKPFGSGGPEEGSYDPDINPNVNFDQVELERFVKKFEESLTKSLDNVKKTMEKSLNFEGVSEDFENLFIKAAKKVATQHQKGMKDAIGNTSNLQKSYYNLVSTKERKAFNLLKSHVDKTHNKLKANVKKEESFRKNIFEIAKRNQKKLSVDELKAVEISTNKQEKAAKQIFELKRTQQEALKDAEYKARASEGKVGLMEATVKRLGGGGVKKGLAAGASGLPIIGKLVKGMNVWSLAATALLTVVTALFGAFVKARRNVSAMSASFRGAGLSAEKASELTANLRAGFEDIGERSGKSVEKLSETILKEIGQFPDLAYELSEAGPKGIKALVGLGEAMTEAGKSWEDVIKSVGEVAKEQAVSTKEYTRFYRLGRGAANQHIMSFEQSINTMLNMNKALRNVTFDTSETEKMFSFMGGTLKSFKGALKLSDDQISEFMMSIAQGLAGMKLPEVAGMFSLVHGRMPQPEDFENLTAKGGLFKLQLQAIAKTVGGIPDTFEKFGDRIYLLDGAMKQFGVNIPFSQLKHFAQGMIDLKDQLKPDALLGDFAKKGEEVFKGIALPIEAFKDAMKMGKEAIEKQTTPMAVLTTALENLMKKGVGIPAVASGLAELVVVMKAIAHPIDTFKENIGKNSMQIPMAMNPFTMPATLLWKLYNSNKNLDRDVRSAEQK